MTSPHDHDVRLSPIPWQDKTVALHGLCWLGGFLFLLYPGCFFSFFFKSAPTPGWEAGQTFYVVAPADRRDLWPVLVAQSERGARVTLITDAPLAGLARVQLRLAPGKIPVELSGVLIDGWRWVPLPPQN